MLFIFFVIRKLYHVPDRITMIYGIDKKFDKARSKQFMKNPKASIYFYQRGRFRYEAVMLTGTMEVLQEEKIKREIWRTGDTVYYKQGVTDPDYCVLKFTAVRGRYYTNFKSESFAMCDLPFM